MNQRPLSIAEGDNRFRQIAESLPQLVWTCNPAGECDYLSQQWVDYTGVPEKDQLGAAWLAQVHPNDRPQLIEGWERAFRSGALFRAEFRIRRVDGKYRWFDTRAIPVRDREGRVVKWIGSNTDVHENRELGATLRESEERLQSIVANLNEGLIISDLEGQVLHWNPAALALHGFSDSAEWCLRLPEFQSIFELRELDGQMIEFAQWPMPRIFRGECLRDYELRLRRLGTDWEKIFSYSGSIIREPGGRPLAFLTLRDVTARRRAEAMLQGQKEILEKVAKGESLDNTLTALLVFLEAQSPDMFCSILLLEENRVRHGAAPRLPAEFCRAIDGAAIGPAAGSCGTAAYRGAPVYVTDIATDPLWADYKHLALPHGLQACWSTPILDGGKRVLGTFAVYHRQTGAPKERHRELITFATHTAAICINRHTTEEALRKSEARYALAVRGTSDGIWDWNILAGTDYLSPRWKELLGFADDELPNVPESFFQRLHPDDVAAAHRAVQAHLERRAPYDIELRLRTKRDEYRWFRCRGQAEWNEAGTPVRMAGSITDITDRTRAQEALRNSAEFNRQIIANADDGIVVLDRNLRYIVWNHFMVELMGLPAEAVLGRHPEELFPWVRKGGQLAAMERALAGETVVLPDSMRIRTGSDRICWVQARLTALRDAAGGIVGIIAMVMDVTERKVSEEKLRKSHEQLRALAARLQSVREEQSAHIAREIHDVLGQQLTALKLDLAWMKRRFAAIEEPGLRGALTQKLAATTALADATIHTVQKVATELRPGLLDKLGLASALEHEAREFARRAGLKCSLKLDQEPSGLEKKKAIDIFRVFQELLTNIARHAKAKSFAVRLAQMGAELILEVSDDGRGIEPEEMERSESLGLLGMRERAQLLNGRLVITGAPGRGTRAVLSISLPTRA